ncbi:serine hydrolase [Goodfellowiella coeruleoviolacea]|uniref:Beta-lactamase class A n=1 Tax=Goodfellowiella coeruleoviolacea TaxID=334858 RepID=A0AAE3GLB4_9PSEU|nr:serine hydrolase [Goodfellowiella coeruleoviolacea]MCP2169650.1 beta-lactamase class A [Goodfellowiella coeruleoviolacea]
MSQHTGGGGIGRRLRAAFTDAGVTGWLHAVDLDRPAAQVGVGADRLVATASMFKIAVALTLFRVADAGGVDPAEAVTLRPEERSGGTTGVGAMLDAATLSLRDLAFLAITLSDNGAADALLDRLGLAEVNRTLTDLGLTRTAVVHHCRDLAALMAADAGVADGAALAPLLADPVVLARLRVLDPALTNRSTPREITRLLAAIWRDEAASADSCAALRRLLGLQVWPHRLASGFPFDDVRVSGKTGTLPTIRNEAGVVEYPDGGRYAVAVFTRSASTAFTLPAADAVIGTTARLAVEHLRASRA